MNSGLLLQLLQMLCPPSTVSTAPEYLLCMFGVTPFLGGTLPHTVKQQQWENGGHGVLASTGGEESNFRGAFGGIWD